MIRFLLIILTVVWSQSAMAGSVRLTFDEFACDAGPAASGRTGAVRYTNPNAGVLGTCGPNVVLGDDGLLGQMKILADPGAVFDLVSFNVRASYEVFRVSRSAFNPGQDEAIAARGGNLIEESLFWRVGPSGELAEAVTPEETESFPFLGITGLRNGEIVASARIDTAGRSSYQPSTAFSDLDELRIRTTANSRDIWTSRRFLFGCDTQCGQATIDDVALTVRVAAIPLPASLMMFGLALLALVPFARRRARA